MIQTELGQIAHIMGANLRNPSASTTSIDYICIDSRGASPHSLFVALKGQNTDGHHFVEDAFRRGASAAVVSDAMLGLLSPDIRLPLIVVPSPLQALQRFAAWYRQAWIGTVIGITGSNGKTIVKDALRTLLVSRNVFASPGSFNSQLGLPLAILSADRRASLALLEVAASSPGDMSILEPIAAPNYGILTNIGLAHFAAFGSAEAIAREKLQLFRHIRKDAWVLVPANDNRINPYLPDLNCTVNTFGTEDDLLRFHPLSLDTDNQLIELSNYSGEFARIRVNTTSPEILSDLHIACYAASLLGMAVSEIAAALDGYRPTETRMEIHSLPDGSRIINDAYSADPISVHSALLAASMVSPPGARRIFVFGGMRELGVRAEAEHRQVGVQAGQCQFTHLVLYGTEALEHTASAYKATLPDGCIVTVTDPLELQATLRSLAQSGDTVLFKGPRQSGMASAARTFSGSLAQRCLWIDLGIVTENVARLRRHCGGAGVIATLKALAYGTDLIQLASWMSRLGLQRFAVSSTQEGIALRKTGIDNDIYVLLPDQDDVASLVRFRLTPIIYSAELVDSFAHRLSKSSGELNVHLKIDTGMHRVGVSPESAVETAKHIQRSGMCMTGVCTHFASADDRVADDSTRAQIKTFDGVLADLRRAGFTSLMTHAANTAAAIRFPQAHYDFVRVGLGLYGVFPSEDVRREADLGLAIALTSRIATVRRFAKGDKLGYNGTYTAADNIKVASVPFGYADGLPWSLSGRGSVMVRRNYAPIVGRISMDQLQIDVTHLPELEVGDEVLIYGARNGDMIRPEAVADQARTIPHELLSRLGRRLQRVYIEP